VQLCRHVLPGHPIPSIVIILMHRQSSPNHERKSYGLK